MTTEELKEFVGQRIESIKQKEVNTNLLNNNGILLQFIPENLLDTNPIDWTNNDHQFKIKRSFRRFSEMDTTFTEFKDNIVGYTPNKMYYSCFQNGIIEVFTSPIERQNSLNRQVDYVCVDDIFYAIDNFVSACKEIHNKIYATTGPYNIFITIIGVEGTFFASFDRNYVTTEPYKATNVRFEPFILNYLEDKIIQEIISSIHYGITTSVQWSKL